MLSKFAKVFERKVWSVQVAHLHRETLRETLFYEGNT